jgi:hypothetical protein
MSLNIVGTTGTNFLLTGSANFNLSLQEKIVDDTAILYRPTPLTHSELVAKRNACLVASTISDVIKNANENFSVGELLSNGTRLRYLANLANNPVSQQYNSSGGVVTSAYEGNAYFVIPGLG